MKKHTPLSKEEFDKFNQDVTFRNLNNKTNRLKAKLERHKKRLLI